MGETETKRINILQTSMILGTWLGLFLTGRNLVLLLSLKTGASLLFILYLFLTLALPAFMWFLFYNFWNKELDALPVTYTIALMYYILMVLFGTLLSQFIAYLYLRFFDNNAFQGYLLDILQNARLEINSTGLLSSELTDMYMEKFDQVIPIIESYSPRSIVFEFISNNLFFGNCTSVILAFIRKK
ncbi:MAG: DUF4199 domain-containing protein [Bacteroidaceae bacterium]|nr:DUF4199 domain-containing protein [Bacteroidaceae bacterium]